MYSIHLMKVSIRIKKSPCDELKGYIHVRNKLRGYIHN